MMMMIKNPKIHPLPEKNEKALNRSQSVTDSSDLFLPFFSVFFFGETN